MGVKRTSRRLVALLGGAAAALTAMTWTPAMAQLSKDEMRKDYFLCTFPVSNTNFTVQYLNDVIAARTTLINTPGGSDSPPGSSRSAPSFAKPSGYSANRREV